MTVHSRAEHNAPVTDAEHHRRPADQPLALAVGRHAHSAEPSVSDERGGGSMQAETLILLPVVILLIAFVAICASYALSGDAVTDAAAAAARAATQQRDPGSADAAARQVATTTLQGSSLNCTPSVSVDTSGFSVPVGQKAQVSVQVTCTVPMQALGVSLGGTRTLTASASSPLDTYRGR